MSASGSFLFTSQLADGIAYAVSIVAQPAGQTCTVANGSGTIAGADVTTVMVSCAVTPVAQNVTSVPTLSQLGLVALFGLLWLLTARQMRTMRPRA